MYMMAFSVSLSEMWLPGNNKEKFEGTFVLLVCASLLNITTFHELVLCELLLCFYLVFWNCKSCNDSLTTFLIYPLREKTLSQKLQDDQGYTQKLCMSSSIALHSTYVVLKKTIVLILRCLWLYLLTEKVFSQMQQMSSSLHSLAQLSPRQLICLKMSLVEVRVGFWQY